MHASLDHIPLETKFFTVNCTLLEYVDEVTSTHSLVSILTTWYIVQSPQLEIFHLAKYKKRVSDNSAQKAQIKKKKKKRLHVADHCLQALLIKRYEFVPPKKTVCSAYILVDRISCKIVRLRVSVLMSPILTLHFPTLR